MSLSSAKGLRQAMQQTQTPEQMRAMVAAEMSMNAMVV